MIKKTYEYLTGRYHPDLVPIPNSEMKLGHQEMMPELKKLTEELISKGNELFIFSAYRNHLDQLRIWNEKATGKRPILDDQGNALDVNSLSNEDIVKNICRWSAIPGASRHHWGTDLDIYCKRSLPSPEYKIQLTPKEVGENGLFATLHQNIDHLIRDGIKFYRPYQRELGGVAPERWHLSFYPIADKLLEKYTIEVFEKNIIETDILFKEVILHNLETFYENYILNISISPESS